MKAAWFGQDAQSSNDNHIHAMLSSVLDCVRRSSRLAVIERDDAAAVVNHPFVPFLICPHGKGRTDGFDKVGTIQDRAIPPLPLLFPPGFKARVRKRTDQVYVGMRFSLL